MRSFANTINQKTKICATLAKHKTHRSLDQWSKHHLHNPPTRSLRFPATFHHSVAITQGNIPVSHMPMYLLARHCTARTFTHIFGVPTPFLQLSGKQHSQSMSCSLCVPNHSSTSSVTVLEAVQVTAESFAKALASKAPGSQGSCHCKEFPSLQRSQRDHAHTQNSPLTSHAQH